MATSIDVLNAIRNEGTEEYNTRIPVATRNNITAVGNALQTYSVLKNEFCDALINRIGKTIIEQKLFKNRLGIFKSGTVDNAQDVEEIFISMAKAEGSYDPTGANPLGRRTPPDVKTIYHRLNRQDYYAISIGDIDFQRAFKSESTLDAFIRGLINSVYSGAEKDEYLAMKELFNQNMDNMTTYTVPSLLESDDPNTNARGIMDFVKITRKAVMDLSFPSTAYNKAGVETWTNPEDLVLFVNKDILAEVDVEVLAKSFNMGKTDFQARVIPMDNFGTDDGGTYAILADKEWFKVFDTLSHMETQRNAHGLFTNYFYHVHQILSVSDFKNCVKFA